MTRQAHHYHKFKALGLCPQCGGKPRPNRALCAPCGAKKSHITLLNYYRLKLKQTDTPEYEI